MYLLAHHTFIYAMHYVKDFQHSCVPNTDLRKISDRAKLAESSAKPRRPHGYRGPGLNSSNETQALTTSAASSPNYSCKGSCQLATKEDVREMITPDTLEDLCCGVAPLQIFRAMKKLKRGIGLSMLQAISGTGRGEILYRPTFPTLT